MDLRYPIGELVLVPDLTESQRPELIDAIRETPGHLASAVAGLTAAQLDTPYRPGGWTVRQVVHHVPDSHMNALVRFKLENEVGPLALFYPCVVLLFTSLLWLIFFR